MVVLLSDNQVSEDTGTKENHFAIVDIIPIGLLNRKLTVQPPGSSKQKGPCLGLPRDLFPIGL